MSIAIRALLPSRPLHEAPFQHVEVLIESVTERCYDLHADGHHVGLHDVGGGERIHATPSRVATISAPTSIVTPMPTDTRTRVKMPGRLAGSSARQKIIVRDAPSDVPPESYARSPSAPPAWPRSRSSGMCGDDDDRRRCRTR
jgi:hypothetical protein